MNTALDVLAILVSIVSALIAYVSYSNASSLADLSKAQLKFHTNGDASYFRGIIGKEFRYLDSVCLAFVYLSVSNYSNLPITFREFELSICGHDSCFYGSGTTIFEEGYQLKNAYNRTIENGVETMTFDGFNVMLLKEHFVEMPLTLPPYGYAEGYLLFPLSHDLIDKHHEATVTAKTTRGDFCYHVELIPANEISIKM